MEVLTGWTVHVQEAVILPLPPSRVWGVPAGTAVR